MSVLTCADQVPADSTAPLVLFAGNASTFTSFQGFVQAVLQAELHVSELAADGTKVGAVVHRYVNRLNTPFFLESFIPPFSLNRLNTPFSLRSFELDQMFFGTQFFLFSKVFFFVGEKLGHQKNLWTSSNDSREKGVFPS